MAQLLIASSPTTLHNSIQYILSCVLCKVCDHELVQTREAIVTTEL